MKEFLLLLVLLLAVVLYFQREHYTTGNYVAIGFLAFFVIIFVVLPVTGMLVMANRRF
jgi:hypothetical protein